MAKAISIKHAVRFWIYAVLAALLLYYGGQFSDHLIQSPSSSTAMRWTGVLIAPLAMVPWIAIIVVSISVVDEYHRRVVLVGTAIALVIDVMMHIAFNAAWQAHLIDNTSYIPELGAAIVAWLVGVSVALAYYRIRQ